MTTQVNMNVRLTINIPSYSDVKNNINSAVNSLKNAIHFTVNKINQIASKVFEKVKNFFNYVGKMVMKMVRSLDKIDARLLAIMAVFTTASVILGVINPFLTVITAPTAISAGVVFTGKKCFDLSRKH